ncbi:hypothetical protein F3N42_05480 [Marinihelvus fidelis]|uniref:Prokaryotic glutathione synthetase ATP-binding domain-containing protein n=1 Tax=Marinihelvus fidelis TaxID=2613842 RepID=A0A5N0TDA0_9GAMM|nr:hypothetical protein [Marinihelvus fidelis]KAA9132668.1 hypothetical protein F3N42_05480 [Marinihelvus fidelis]
MENSSPGRRCAFLTMDSLEDFVSDADLAIAPMQALGWVVEKVSWRDTAADWDRFDMVYICTPWDYQDAPDAFLAVLRRIDASSARLVNDLAIVEWNLDKRYLREIESRGVAIVPSRWHDRFSVAQVDAAFEAFDAGRMVIKPVVGANADHTYVLERPLEPGLQAQLEQSFSERPHFIQPFIDAVVTEGEYSLFFFGGEYSHAILKTPASGDFRTQEEHGSNIQPVTPPAGLVDTARAALAQVEPAPVYARADFVRDTGDVFRVMELELIEPSLYFRTDTDSAARFAAALDQAGRQP